MADTTDLKSGEITSREGSTPSPGTIKWYRYDTILWTESRIELTCHEYQVASVTKHGVWLFMFGGAKKKFILKNAKKRFACPTREEAFVSYQARKKRRKSILQAQLKRVEAELALTPDDPKTYILFEELS